jgi:hypothetical protein
VKPINPVKRKPNFSATCVRCNSPFERYIPPKHPKPKSCSRECYYLARKENKKPVQYGPFPLGQKKHGMFGTPEYICWSGMIQRCTNPNDRGYVNYGARGIMVCDPWRVSFENFFADMGTRPSPGHSIDRIDVNGNYEPSNCRWATAKEQLRNTRFNRMITARGKTMCLASWCDISPVSRSLIKARLKLGWSTESAIFTPKRGSRAERVGSP